MFTVTFAILQKSEVLGKGKKQADALVALAVGLILIAFGNAVGIIIQLTAFLGVGLVILLVLMVLMGFMAKEGEFELPGWMRKTLNIVVFVVVIIVVLVVTGTWDWIYDWIFTVDTDGSAVAANVVFVIVVIAAIFGVMASGGKKEEKKKAD
jgi:chromate transport protein ChrA